ncbi:transposase family protein [Frankia sp. Cj3]|uniref:transposase family protein n=1 Tax=Frankia sp. Cj3 TaxID=2880976 RepID=UPI001EF5A243|nr:transposase family protein [Frankia sp. Cj3]
MLALWFAGVLAGQQTFAAVWEWAADLPADVLARFGLTRGVPSERTIRRLVESCDPAGLDEALSGWIARAATVAGPAGEAAGAALRREDPQRRPVIPRDGPDDPGGRR